MLQKIIIWLAVVCLAAPGLVFAQSVGETAVVIHSSEMKLPGERVGTIVPGNTVTVEKVQGEWLWVQHAHAKGWIARQDVRDARGAIAYFSDQIRRNPNDALAHLCRGNSHAAAGSKQKAAEHYDRAIALDSQNPDAYRLRAHRYLQTDSDRTLADLDQAVRLYKRVNRSSDDFYEADAYVLRGSNHLVAERFDRALADFNEAVRLDPQDFRAYCGRSMVHDKQGHAEQAESDMKKAFELGDEDAGDFMLWTFLIDKPDELGQRDPEPQEQPQDKPTKPPQETASKAAETETPTAVEQADSSFAGSSVGEEWGDNGLEMKFCWCPPGKFKMGSPADEASRSTDEDQVDVTLTRGFWLGKYEVTQAQFQFVMGKNPSEVKAMSLPVGNVSWKAATEFCQQLTEQEREAGRLPRDWEYRLPTEAQWEYACRAGTTTGFSFGDDAEQLGEYAWYVDNSDDRAHPVGRKKPNAWGLHNMHGNVLEWCRDSYQDKLPGGTDPEVNTEAVEKVLRGGAWDNAASICRSANRSQFSSYRQFQEFGFRVCLTQVVPAAVPETKPLAQQTTDAPIEPVLQTGHSDGPDEAVFSPDGRYVVTTGANTAILWEVATGRQVRRYQATSALQGLAFSPDGSKIVTESDDHALIWDRGTGQQLQTFYVDRFLCFDISPDGQQMVVVRYDYHPKVSRVALWDTASGQQIREFEGEHAKLVGCVAFSPDGRYIATGSDEKTVVLWDAINGRKLRTLAGHAHEVDVVAFYPDSRRLVAGSHDYETGTGELVLWDVPRGTRLAQVKLDFTFYSLAISDDGSHVAVGESHRERVLFRADDLEQIRSFRSDDAQGFTTAFSPDSRLLFGGQVLWDVETGEQVRAFPAYHLSVRDLLLVPSGEQVIADLGGKLVLADIRTASDVRISGVNSSGLASLTPDGRQLTLITYDDGYVLTALDVHTGRGLCSIPMERSPGSVSVSDDGRRALLGFGYRAQLWELPNGRLLQKFGGDAHEWGLCPALSPDGRFVVTTPSLDKSSSGSIRHVAVLHNAETGRQLRAFDTPVPEGMSYALLCFSFTPDGETLVTAGYEYQQGNYEVKRGLLVFWDVKTGKKLRELRGHNDRIKSVTFTPDARYAVSYSYDEKTTIVWDLATGRQLGQFTTHLLHSNPPRLSADGQRLVTVSWDGVARIYAVATGAELARLVRLSGDQGWLTVTPQGLFDGPGDPREHIAFRIGGGLNVEPADRFVQDFHHPGLLAKILSGEPLPTPLTRAPSTSITETKPAPTKATVSEAADVELKANDVVVTTQRAVVMSGTKRIGTTAPGVEATVQQLKDDRALVKISTGEKEISGWIDIKYLQRKQDISLEEVTQHFRFTDPLPGTGAESKPPFPRPWKDEEKRLVSETLLRIKATAPGLFERVTAYGPVKLHRIVEAKGKEWAIAYVPSLERAVYFTDDCFERSDRQEVMFWVLSHEFAHVADIGNHLSATKGWDEAVGRRIHQVQQGLADAGVTTPNDAQTQAEVQEIASRFHDLARKAGLPRLYAATNKQEALATTLEYYVLGGTMLPDDICEYLELELLSLPYQRREDVTKVYTALQSNPEDAIDLLSEVIDTSKNLQGCALFIRGRNYVSLRQYDKALADFEGAIDAFRHSVRYQVLMHEYRASIFRSRGDRPRAVEAITAAIDLAPRNPALYLRRGNLLRALMSEDELKQDSDEVLSNFDQAIKLAPSYYTAYEGRASLRVLREEYELADADVTKLIELKPELDISYYRRGEVRYEMKQYDEALKDFKAGMALEPRETFKNPRGFLGRAKVKLAQGKWREAVDSCEQLNATWPKPVWDTQPLLGKAYVELGEYEKALVAFRLYLSARLARLDEVAGPFERAVTQFSPKTGTEYGSRGLGWHSLGKHEQAVDDLTKAVELGQEESVVYETRGQSLAELGRFDEAISDFDEVVRLKPKWPGAFEMRARAWRGNNEPDKAVADFKTAVQMWKKIGRSDRVIAVLAEAIEIKPKDSGLYMTRGSTYTAQSSFDEAIADYTAAIKILPDLPDGYKKRAAVYAISGQTDKAIADYEQLKILEPQKATSWDKIIKILKQKAKKAEGNAHDANEEWNTLMREASELYRAEEYNRAIIVARKALEVAEKSAGPEDPLTATSLGVLANHYRAQGKYEEAEQLYKRALSIREKALGPDHPDVGSTLNILAVLHVDQRKFDEAEPLLKRSLEIRLKALGPGHPDVLVSLDNFAGLFKAQGNYLQAGAFYKRALAIRLKTLGPDHADVATSLNYMGTLCVLQGKYALGEPLLKRALAIREKALGSDHVDVATSLDMLARLYDGQAKYAEAEPLYKRALSIREKALGPDHPAVASSLINLATPYSSQARYTEAEPLYERALAIYEETPGPNHSDLASCLNDLALLYYGQDKYEAAEPLFKRALAIHEKALGADHPFVATDLHNLALVYSDQAKYAAAEPLLKRALAILEETLGPHHPRMATSLNNLAVLYGKQDKHEEVEPLLKRALAIHEEALGPDHPSVATDLINLGVVYSRQAKYAAAEPLYERGLTIFEKALGPNHPSVATSLKHLATLYRATQRSEEASKLEQRAAQIEAQQR